jgi:formylglycine-generating enzyme required for sulfatase activity
VEALERALSPEGKASRRRPSLEPTRRSQAEHGTASQGASTEHTQHSVQQPKNVVQSSDKTLEQATVPKAPVVWKPPGPKPAEGGGNAKLILAAIAGVLLLGGGAAVAYVMFGGSHDPSATSSEQVASSSKQERPTSNKKPVVDGDSEKPVVPPRFVADDKAKLVAINGKKYPERIIFRFGSGGEERFLLMQPESGVPFYLAENKATNALFSAFREEAGAGGKTAWKNDGPELPALNVTWDEARRCAEWVGGQLATPQELDFAAGMSRRESRPGPAKPPGAEIAIKTARPKPVNRVHDDVSPQGVRDLGGNGREWTRTKITANSEEYAILRGRMYTLSTPLTYDELARQQNDRDAQTQRPAVPSPQTGFRVAVEIKP